jgi:arginase
LRRSTAVVGAPSSIGIRPYEDGEARHLDRAPGVLRARGLVERLGAIDRGDVVPPAYGDYARPPGRARNEAQVAAYSRALGQRVRSALKGGRFAVVVGGDCSIVLGCLLGARRAAAGPIGLVYVDAHADFATAKESTHGSVSGMTLALASGRGDPPLARLAGRAPLVDAAHVALVGRRDVSDSRRGQDALAGSRVLDLPGAQLRAGERETFAREILARVASRDVRGFWLHLDVDVLNPAIMPAVDSPEPGGPMPDELARLLTPLVRHPLALGLDVSIYDPAFDADRSSARLLLRLLEALLTSSEESFSPALA